MAAAIGAAAWHRQNLTPSLSLLRLLYLDKVSLS